jgi:hypothetical protein
MALANVALTNTFDEWRIRTNQLVTEINDINSNASIKLVSNSAALSVSLGATRKSNVYVDLVISTRTSDVSSSNLASALSVNLVSNLAVSAYKSTNASFDAANISFDTANISFDTANAAFESANNVSPQITPAFVQANTARNQANAAYDKANSSITSIPLLLDVEDSSRYIVFGDSTTGNLLNANVSTTLTYNPNTGTLSATVFNSTSDRNKKQNIRIIADAVEKTEKLNGVQFDWVSSGQPSAGIVAQDLQEVMPELVASDMSVTYSGIIGILVEAIKELNARIKILENK